MPMSTRLKSGLIVSAGIVMLLGLGACSPLSNRPAQVRHRRRRTGCLRAVMQLSAEIVLEKAAEQPRQILRQHRAAPGSVCFASQCHHSNKKCCSHDVLLINSVGMDVSCAGHPSA